MWHIVNIQKNVTYIVTSICHFCVLCKFKYSVSLSCLLSSQESPRVQNLEAFLIWFPAWVDQNYIHSQLDQHVLAHGAHWRRHSWASFLWKLLLAKHSCRLSVKRLGFRSRNEYIWCPHAWSYLICSKLTLIQRAHMHTLEKKFIWTGRYFTLFSCRGLEQVACNLC
mgnify:CR=1 FL=1